MELEQPVQADYVEKMKAILAVMDDFLNAPGEPKKIGIALLMFPLGEAPNGRMNYMSTSRREDMICAMKELLAKWEGRAVEHNTPQ